MEPSFLSQFVLENQIRIAKKDPAPSNAQMVQLSRLTLFPHICLISGGLACISLGFFYREALRHRPLFTEGPQRIHRYQYSVGIVVRSGVIERHFSHDPDIDIGA